MEALELRLGGVRVSISFLERRAERTGAPYLDWLECRVRVETRSFTGSFPWSVMPSEFTSLANRLTDLYNRYPEQGSLEFSPVEPNWSFTLRTTRSGGLAGACVLRPDVASEDELTSALAIEQGDLLVLARDVRGFVRAAAPDVL